MSTPKKQQSTKPAAKQPAAASSSKPKQNTKVLRQQKRRRRQWLAFVRMVRYGVNNFSRNAWLTIAATAVMTITLLIIFTTVAARMVMEATLAKTGDEVPISIYLDNETPEEIARNLQSEIEKLESVRRVEYISAEESRKRFAETQKDNQDSLNAISEAPNLNPAILRISLEDINETDELKNFENNSALLKEHKDPARESSYEGGGKVVIDTIGSWVRVAGNVGLGASVVFIVLSSLIVFNTIRMAIFNRKEEIQMMKLIGADKSFIRGPFVVEATVYGFFAALMATGFGTLGVLFIDESLAGFGFEVELLVRTVTTFAPFVLLGMILLGMIIGVLSSLMATRRYLRIS